MSDQHLDAIGVVLARSAPADDPGRRHLERCEQCRVLLRGYERFLAGGRTDEQAELQLQAFVSRTVEAHPPARGASRAAAAKPERPHARPSPMRRRRAGARWLPVGFGVALAAAAVLLLVRLRGAESPDILLRQSPTPATNGSQLVALEPPAAAVGGVDVRWRPVEAADAYAVRIYGPDLRLLASLSSQLGTTLRLDRSIATLTTAPESLFVRVVALRDSATIGQSELRALILPR